MGQKLHRSHRSVFRRRSPIIQLFPLIMSLIGVVAVIAVGFFGAKYLTEHAAPEQISTESSVASLPQDNAAPNDNTSTDTPTVALEDTALRAFYLPASALQNRAALTATVEQAVAAGYTGVVMEMKDADGVLYFRSTTSRAMRVNNYADNALSITALQELFATVRTAGLQPIPLLHAFRDNAAARVLSDARITPSGNADWVWYDKNPADGGKAWLNPYADAAHLYIIDLARELRDAGAAAILLDSVQFPDQTSGADFGSEAAGGQSRGAELTDFIAETKQLLFNSCPVILGCIGTAAQGNDTGVYGANPLTFGADVFAPSLPVNDALETSVHQMMTRIHLLGTQTPELAPLLQVQGCTPEQIKQAIADCHAGGTNTYILYSSDGHYDFAAIN